MVLETEWHQLMVEKFFPTDVPKEEGKFLFLLNQDIKTNGK